MSVIKFGQRPAAVAAAVFFVMSVVGASPAIAQAPAWSHRDAQVCARPGPARARCTAVARTFYRDGRVYRAPNRSALAAAAAADGVGYYNGTSIRTAYGLTAQGDASRVIAIVDANDDPDAFRNVTQFRTDSGLPAIQDCTLGTLTTLTSGAAPCFTKTNQTGGTSLPAADAGWSNEIDLDLQAASADCPMCSILLLESTNSSIGNLGTAVTTAANTAHVVAISNSYGISGDYPGSFAPAYDNAAKKGIAVTASAGDGGYGVLFPASATNVIGVGGTTLSVDASGARTTETAWAGTGSGCSVYNAAPSWQSIPDNPCSGKKAISDLSADADPNSGLAIYTTYSGVTGYWVFGGTSLSSPIIAASYATKGGYNATTLAGQVAWAPGTPYFDVTAGSNGTCSRPVLCTAGAGWDGPTGRGSIAGPRAPSVLTTITVSPVSASVQIGGTQQFNATAKDQYGQPMSPPPTIDWSVDGGGTINAAGLFSATTAGGPFTVTAANGSVSNTASVTVTNVPADFSLSVSPAMQSVSRGATATYTVTITPTNGFNGQVTLTLTGQPSGSTVTFTPNQTGAGMSTLTVKTLQTTSRQTYSMTIHGVSGSLNHTAGVSLRVTR
jgi:hypothetical protein